MNSVSSSNHQSPKRILAIVAHADDETLGIGGTLARHSSLGDSVFVASFTDGVGARNADLNAKQLRQKNALLAAEIVGFSWAAHYDFPDNRMDTVPLLEIVQKIEELKERLTPDIVYLHSSADLNIDHQVMYRACITAFRPLPGECWEELRAFEIPSATDFAANLLPSSFQPNLYVNIKPNWEMKVCALSTYQDEMRPFPHSRSLRGLRILAEKRGTEAGIELAEAFQVIRRVERS